MVGVHVLVENAWSGFQRPAAVEVEVAVGLRQVDSPDVTLIPWLNIVILSLLVAGLLWIRALWRRFWRRM
ncbi:MAG: DUF1523 family protein, partial [Xanthomonadales bacterium]|nr:DUF1523 family protein [Xanthomonadales bacterium]